MKSGKRTIGSKLWTGSILAALVAAVVIFTVLLQLEKKMLSEYEKGTVYVAATDIPKGVVITEENAEEYLRPEQVDVKLIPKTSLQSREQLRGLVSGIGIEEGVLLTQGMFVQEEVITGNMSEPVVAGFKAEDLYQVVGGVLRAGDRIHIYTVSESGYTTLIWEDVFVQQVFDGSGGVIRAGDVTTAAQRINVYFDAKNVEQLYTELAKGTLRVVKVCD